MDERLRLEVRGAVQGVGFRPFVFRLAVASGLRGWVVNDPRGVVIEVEGTREELERFLRRLEKEKPRPAMVQSVRTTWLPAAGDEPFRILASRLDGKPTAEVLPDIATCEACLAEVLDPADRRHGYPFTNCTHCGPRFSIIESLPYDRSRTTMRGFTMCPACRKEYDDPLDRRFHAQPNACPACGPRLALWTAEGREIAGEAQALDGAVAALRRGEVVAVKGLGGFLLMVDARDSAAVVRLRANKPRREKPFAMMVRDLDQAGRLCHVDRETAGVLDAPDAPVVLLPRRSGAPVAPEVAPGNPCLGIMLPYTPLHHLLLRSVDVPLVATSGNLSDEPICTDEQEAVRRLGTVADRYLVHDRPIARHVDDSVVRILESKPRSLRRARGRAPRPVLVDRELPSVLAAGAHLKNTAALSVGSQVFVSQHIGDMETPQALEAFERVIEDFLRLYDARPVAVAHDLHPDYATTRWAREVVGHAGRLAALPLVPIQHHHAHLAACLADNGYDGTALGVIWDGTGHGTDGNVWGGEFLLGTPSDFRRVAHLRPFRLPGGETAIREPRRSAIALLWEIEGESALTREELAPVRDFPAAERRLLASMLSRELRSPVTTSAGRLFDAVAALTGLRQRASFEGQAAMQLEFAADPGVTDAYPVGVAAEAGTDVLTVDWRAAIASLVDEQLAGVPVAAIAARFHNMLVEAIVRVAHAVREPVVALSGGCFQNRLLVERAAGRLRDEGFEVLLHREVPPNDGGISFGQVVVAAARVK